jgi:DNA-binding CsgD family transcriptional regulator
MVKRVLIYGVALAAGALALQWLEYRAFALEHGGEIAVLCIALAFLTLGVFIGVRLFGPAGGSARPGNPEAQAALGISAREREVLLELAEGRTNKEIAARLNVSPNTVKTHVARLYEKLEARRRTEAIAKARALGLLG